MDVAIVSCRELPEPDPDAAPLARALAAAGLESAVLAWDDPQVDWSRARLTVLRSAWNYPQNAAAFLEWAEATSRVTELWNPLPVIRWNTHKRYLIELAERGLPVTPTVLLEQGSKTTLASILAERGWTDVVVKPAISAASFRTMRVHPENRNEGETHLRTLAAERDVLVQQYLPSVEEYGERALVWIAGELTHAVRKSARFTGEDESVSAAVEISVAEASLARRVIETVEGPILYGRIDVAPGPRGEPHLMELELVEPSLFFVQCQAALVRFVGAICAKL